MFVCNFQAVVAEQLDIDGLRGIRWGTRLADVPHLKLVESTKRIQTYEWEKGPPQLGDTQVSKMQLVAIDGEFARVSIRYSGESNHRRILAYLESHFGPIDRSPGRMMRGLNQQYSWRTDETQVNLMYHSFRERGDVFFESRTLAPRFLDVLPEHAF
jgi:hypothetical protein